ncbi:MAG TPA: MarR family transcriptional regulator, partial [Aggregicoccus sp.]|nr:MarR family transcriptional regulator [Aggregicoccus sp.]
LRRTLHRHLTRSLAHRTPRSFLELRALRAVEREHLHTQVALSERLLVDTAAVSRLVAKLEQDGLLARQPGEDRRCVHLEVTAAGRAQLRVLEAELGALDTRVRKHLTPEEARTLSRLLEKLHEGLRAREPQPPRREV